MERIWRGKLIGEWLTLLDAPDEHLQWEAVDAVRHLLPSDDSLPILLAMSRKATGRARRLALHAIFDLADEYGPRSEEPEETVVHRLHSYVDECADLLSDVDPRVQLQAAMIIERMGALATTAVPVLTGYLQRYRDLDEVAKATKTLNEASPEDVCEVLVEALRHIGPAAASAKSVLSTLTNDSSASVRRAAENVLLDLAK